ncbi:MAG: hypothetical protein ACO1TE_17645 [Prosthecobacter sp.]
MPSHTHPLVAAFICQLISIGLLLWSKRMVARGKPPIPKHVAMLTGLFCFILYLQMSLPTTTGPRPWSEVSKDMREYNETNTALRTDLDNLQADLAALNSVVSTVFWVGLMMVIFPLSGWMVERFDDRNWIHGGIRPPPPGKMPPQPPEPEG